MSYYDERPKAPVWPAYFLVVLVLALAGVFLVWRFGPDLAGRISPGPKSELRSVKYRDGLFENEKSVIEMYKRCKPSVVNVTSMTVQRDFFTRNLQSIPKGMGTGFVWDKDGRIVTNYHVIEGANEAVVTLDNGTKHKASLVGASRNWDLAVLRIKAAADALEPIDIGESRTLLVGQERLRHRQPFRARPIVGGRHRQRPGS